MLNRARRTQRGLSIVEMMVGVAIGLFVVAGAAMLLATQLSDNRRLLLETQVQQDLRATADIIVRELRRAGSRGQAQTGVWTPAAAPSANPYTAVEPIAGEGEFADDEEASSAVLAYSSADEAVPLEEDGVVTNAERRGFRLDNGVIQTQLGAGNWQALTDGNTVRVTRFSVRMNRQPVPLACPKACPVGAVACPPMLEVRDMQVDITGQAAHDPAVQRSVRSNVRVRNDTVNGACPA
jgi:type IV pilus assembly protein PilW